MAEIKRVPLQTVEFGKDSSKKNEKTKQIAASFRFELNLTESNEQKYPEFNYSHLLKSAEKKRKKDKKKDDNSATNGSTVLDDDDDEKVLDVARYFEAKYGNRKKSDYVDLGAGYDESDSFIDNTDAYDEIVPEEMTTVHGGFYVNSGPLEFKDSENARLHRNSVNDENGNDDDSESSDEDSEEEEEANEKTSNKRSLSSSENEGVDEISQPPKAKPRIEDGDAD